MSEHKINDSAIFLVVLWIFLLLLRASKMITIAWIWILSPVIFLFGIFILVVIYSIIRAAIEVRRENRNESK